MPNVWGTLHRHPEMCQVVVTRSACPKSAQEKPIEVGLFFSSRYEAHMAGSMAIYGSQSAKSWVRPPNGNIGLIT